MSLPPALRQALEESREELRDAAAVYLNSPKPYTQMKARISLNVVINFIDWFKDEAERGDIAEVARVATAALGHMVALLASTAGDDKMEEHGSLIIATIVKELATYLYNSRPESPHA